MNYSYGFSEFSITVFQRSTYEQVARDSGKLQNFECI